jgi:hypothetical protein
MFGLFPCYFVTYILFHLITFYFGLFLLCALGARGDPQGGGGLAISFYLF